MKTNHKKFITICSITSKKLIENFFTRIIVVAPERIFGTIKIIEISKV